MIYVEDQTIKLNGVVLPGLVKSIEVTESAKVDEQEVEGSATKPKQATGYEDAKVNIELIIDDTPEAITVSCNYFFYEVGRLTGIKTLDDYATQFGLGQYTGIEIGGPNSAEAKGALASPEYAEANDL